MLCSALWMLNDYLSFDCYSMMTDGRGARGYVREGGPKEEFANKSSNL